MYKSLKRATMSSPDHPLVFFSNTCISFGPMSLIVSATITVLFIKIQRSKQYILPLIKFSNIFLLQILSGRGIFKHCLNLLMRAESIWFGQLVQATTKLPLERLWASLSIWFRSLLEASLFSLDLDLQLELELTS